MRYYGTCRPVGVPCAAGLAHNDRYVKCAMRMKLRLTERLLPASRLCAPTGALLCSLFSVLFSAALGAAFSVFFIRTNHGKTVELIRGKKREPNIFNVLSSSSLLPMVCYLSLSLRVSTLFPQVFHRVDGLYLSFSRAVVELSTFSASNSLIDI